MNEKWFTLCTKPGCEKKVVTILKKKNIEAYCPLKKVQAYWSFRKYDYEPLLPGYVFVKISEGQRDEVRNVSGVVNFMYWLNAPAEVKEKEIEIMRSLVENYDEVKVEKVPVKHQLLKMVNSEGVQQDLKQHQKWRVLKATLPSIGYRISVALKEESAEQENVSYLYPYYQYTDAI